MGLLTEEIIRRECSFVEVQLHNLVQNIRNEFSNFEDLLKGKLSPDFDKYLLDLERLKQRLRSLEAFFMVEGRLVSETRDISKLAEKIICVQKDIVLLRMRLEGQMIEKVLTISANLRKDLLRLGEYPDN